MELIDEWGPYDPDDRHEPPPEYDAPGEVDDEWREPTWPPTGLV